MQYDENPLSRLDLFFHHDGPKCGCAYDECYCVHEEEYRSTLWMESDGLGLHDLFREDA